MRRLFWIALAGMAILSGGAAWRSAMRSSTTVTLDQTGYELTYTIAWGWGMDERIDLSRAGAWLPGPTSGWEWIWKKPYNSGVVVYRSDDGKTYYLGLTRNLFRFEPATGTLKEVTEIEDRPPFTPLAEKISSMRRHEEIDAADPGAPWFPAAVPAGFRSVVPTSPPRSRYYRGLSYLGRFGVLLLRDGPLRDGSMRGDGTAFAPADATPEPRLPLHVFRP